MLLTPSDMDSLIEEIDSLHQFKKSDTQFQIWHGRVERALRNNIGPESYELQDFKKLRFTYNGPMVGGKDYSHISREVYLKDLQIAKTQLQDIGNNTVQAKRKQSHIQKVFISHSSKDVAITEKLYDLIRDIGVDESDIFCTSVGPKPILLGDNFLESIRNAILEETIVIFLLSPNYYASVISLCEMGAAWALSKTHIPLLTPGFNYDEIKGVFPSSQAALLDQKGGLNNLKRTLEQRLGINTSSSPETWERKRDQFISSLQQIN